MRNKNLLRNERAIGQLEHPAWPRLRGEALDTIDTVGCGDAGLIVLRAQGKAARRRIDKSIATVDEHAAAGGAVFAAEEEGMIAAGASARDRAGGETAEAIGLEPFELSVHEE